MPIDVKPRLPMAERLLALHEMGADVTRAETEAQLLGALRAHVGRAFTADHASIALRASDGRRLRIIELHRTEDHDTEEPMPGVGTDHPIEGSVSERSLLSMSIICNDDLATSTQVDLAAHAAAGLSSAATIPLYVSGHPLGTLTVGRALGAPFTDHDRLLFRQAASYVSSAIKTLRTSAEARRADTERHKAEMIMARRASELDSLNRISGALLRYDLTQAVELISTEIASLRGIEVCRIAALDEAGALRVITSASQHGARFQDRHSVLTADSPDVLAIETSNAVLWRQPHPDDVQTIDRLRTLGVTSVFALPIVWEGRAIGCLTAGSTGGHRWVTDEHIVMGAIVCRELAAAANDGRRTQGLLSTLEGSLLELSSGSAR